jgi:hypothetical protein
MYQHYLVAKNGIKWLVEMTLVTQDDLNSFVCNCHLPTSRDINDFNAVEMKVESETNVTSTLYACINAKIDDARPTYMRIWNIVSGFTGREDGIGFFLKPIEFDQTKKCFDNFDTTLQLGQNPTREQPPMCTVVVCKHTTIRPEACHCSSDSDSSVGQQSRKRRHHQFSNSDSSSSDSKLDSKMFAMGITYGRASGAVVERSDYLQQCQVWSLTAEVNAVQAGLFDPVVNESGRAAGAAVREAGSGSRPPEYLQQGQVGSLPAGFNAGQAELFNPVVNQSVRAAGSGVA